MATSTAGTAVLISLCLVASLVLQGDAQRAPWGPKTRPLLIGHRGGANAFTPEHSVASYLSGIAHGADVSECDVCWSKDLVPVCRHEPFLSLTTDALIVFPNMVKTVLLDGKNYTDVWANDLTIAQLKSLRLVQKFDSTNRTHQYDGMFQIVTLEEHIQLVMAAERTIGIIPELKHSTFFNNLSIFKDANTTSMEQLLKVLTKYGFTGPANSPAWRANPVWIQSFEQNDLVYVASVSCIPLVQLTDSDGTFTADRGTAWADLVSEAGLDRIVQYATVLGPWKNTLATFNGSAPGVDTGLCARAQERGMVVTPYTFRPEKNQMAPVMNGQWYDEFQFFLRNISIDGVWCDAVVTLADYMDMEAIVGQGWSQDQAMRVNHMQVPCKRADSRDIALAKLQYPQLF